MKKLFLFLFASLLSVSMFAAGETGKTKAQAIPYDWDKGIFVESTAGEGKWYVVMLRNDQTDYDTKYNGPFNSQGKTTDGLTNINVMVVNPLDESATIDVIAYIGDNETSRHFTLAKGGFKAMTFGAGMFVQMGIDRVYLYLVMDVDISAEEAAAMDAVNVNVSAVESENVVSFVPVAFDWTNFPAKTAGTTIPANKETWVEFDFGAVEAALDDDMTYKFYAEKADASKITIEAGLSYDCPATSIQEQSQELKSASTAKVLDAAKLAIMPKKVYLRIKAPQALTIYAEQVGIPAPDPEAPVLFNKADAKEVELYDGSPAKIYSLNNGQLAYKVAYNTLKADENYYRQIEVTNNEDHEITIVGKATKTFVDGKAYSAVSKSVTIPAGQTYYKKIDKTMQSAVGSAATDTIWAVGPAFNVTFKLTQQPNDPEFCQSANPFVWNEWNQQNGGYQWYEVNIAAAKTAKADIVLTMETVNENEEANITVDLASVCELGAPLQSYSGKSKSRTKTISYSLFKDNANDEMYVRVRADKNIKVKAELLTAVIYNETVYGGWSAETGIDKAARVEEDLTITGTIKALGVTLADENVNITIKNGGKLIVGKEGIKGSQNVDQIVIEEGGQLLISPEAGSNNKPFVTAKKELDFGPQTAAGATLDELHEFIALPVENREAKAGVNYAHWDYTTGWVANDGFRNTFVGYNVTQYDGQDNYHADYIAAFKGQLASNSNQQLKMAGHGWFAFGNSWTAPIKLADVWGRLGSAQAAIHTYVATPQTVDDVDFLDNYYVPMTSDIAGRIGVTEIAPMQGFFLYTETATTATLNYGKIYDDATTSAASPAPAKRVADNRNQAAVVLRGGYRSDFVFMIEGEATNATKMVNENLAIYAEDELGQVASENLIGTMLSIKTNDATEYTLSFAWLNGETLYLKDLVNGNIIAMTAENTYTFTAEPNSVSERFQVIGRNDAPTAIENTDAIEGANKFIENGKIVIIKNGVKYNVLGAEL